MSTDEQNRRDVEAVLRVTMPNDASYRWLATWALDLNRRLTECDNERISAAAEPERLRGEVERLTTERDAATKKAQQAHLDHISTIAQMSEENAELRAKCNAQLPSVDLVSDFHRLQDENSALIRERDSALTSARLARLTSSDAALLAIEHIYSVLGDWDWAGIAKDVGEGGRLSEYRDAFVKLTEAMAVLERANRD